MLEDFGLLIQEVDQLKPERLDMVTSWFERQITDLTHLASLQVRHSYVEDFAC